MEARLSGIAARGSLLRCDPLQPASNEKAALKVIAPTKPRFISDCRRRNAHGLATRINRPVEERVRRTAARRIRPI